METVLLFLSFFVVLLEANVIFNKGKTVCCTDYINWLVFKARFSIIVLFRDDQFFFYYYWRNKRCGSYKIIMVLTHNMERLLLVNKVNFVFVHFKQFAGFGLSCVLVIKLYGGVPLFCLSIKNFTTQRL